MTVLEQAPASSDSPSPASRTHLGLPLAIIGVAVVLAWWMTRNAVFFQDDFVFLNAAREKPWGLYASWLTDPLFAHFSPVGQVEYQILASFSDPWLIARLIMLVTLAAAAYALYWLACELHAAPFTAAWAACWFALSLVVWRLLQWWGAWVIVFVHLPFILMATAAAVRYLKSGSKGFFVLFLGLSTLACATYEAAYLAPVWTALTVGLLAVREAVPARALWRRGLLAFVVQSVISLAFLAIYLRFYSGDLPKPTPQQFVTFMAEYHFASLIPSLFGLKQPGLATSVSALVVVTSLAFLVVVAVHYRRLWRELMLLAAALLAFSALFAYGRGAMGGVYLADLQYYIDATAVLGLGLALLPSYRNWPSGRSWLVPLVLLAISMVGGFQGRAALEAENPWAAGRYWTNEVRQNVRLDDGDYLASDLAPPFLTFPHWEMNAELSRVLPYFAELPIGAGTGQPLIVDPFAQLKQPGSVLAKGRLDRCLENGESVTFRASLPAGVRQLLVVNYSSEAPSSLGIEQSVGGTVLRREGEERFGTWWPIQLPAEPSATFARLATGPADSLTIGVVGPRVCMTTWEIREAPQLP